MDTIEEALLCFCVNRVSVVSKFRYMLNNVRGECSVLSTTTPKLSDFG